MNLVHWSKWSVSNASSQIFLGAFLDLVLLTTFTTLSTCFSKSSLNVASSSCESNLIRRILFSFSNFLWCSHSRVSESLYSHSSLNFLKSASVSIEDIPVPNALAAWGTFEPICLLMNTKKPSFPLCACHFMIFVFLEARPSSRNQGLELNRNIDMKWSKDFKNIANKTSMYKFDLSLMINPSGIFSFSLN